MIITNNVTERHYRVVVVHCVLREEHPSTAQCSQLRMHRLPQGPTIRRCMRWEWNCHVLPIVSRSRVRFLWGSGHWEWRERSLQGCFLELTVSWCLYVSRHFDLINDPCDTGHAHLHSTEWVNSWLVFKRLSCSRLYHVPTPTHSSKQHCTSQKSYSVLYRFLQVLPL